MGSESYTDKYTRTGKGRGHDSQRLSSRASRVVFSVRTRAVADSGGDARAIVLRTLDPGSGDCPNRSAVLIA
jgi:hypothetical protein